MNVALAGSGGGSTRRSDAHGGSRRCKLSLITRRHAHARSANRLRGTAGPCELGLESELWTLASARRSPSALKARWAR